MFLSIFLVILALGGHMSVEHECSEQKESFEISSCKSLDQIRDELNDQGSHKRHSKVVIEMDLDERGNSTGFLCMDNANSRSHGQYLGYPRPYETPLTENERQDIHFIVTFLANHSIFSLAAHKNDLQSAGDRIDHIHPLVFLGFVFSDEELKICIKKIRGNGWVWKDFFGGIKESLNTETQAQNMKIEYVQHFAAHVKLDARYIVSSVQKRNWDEFMDILIARIPRKGDHDRYKD